MSPRNRSNAKATPKSNGSQGANNTSSDTAYRSNNSRRLPASAPNSSHRSYRFERDPRIRRRQEYARPYTNNGQRNAQHQPRDRRPYRDNYRTPPTSSSGINSFRGRLRSQHGYVESVNGEKGNGAVRTDKKEVQKDVGNYRDPKHNYRLRPRIPPTCAKETESQPPSKKLASKRHREHGPLEEISMKEEPLARKARTCNSGARMELSLPKSISKLGSMKPVAVKILVKEEKKQPRKRAAPAKQPIVLDEKMSAMMWLWDQKWEWEKEKCAAKPFPARSMLCRAFGCSKASEHKCDESAFGNVDSVGGEAVNDEDWMVEASELLIEDIDRELLELDKMMEGQV